MPIHLTPPEHNPSGPDGRGWNRLSINAHMGGDDAQCALRPRSYSKLYESEDTRRARWGGFGHCISGGDCKNCPVFKGEGRFAPRTLESFSPRVLIRLLDRTPEPAHSLASTPPVIEPHAMNKPEDGWGSFAYPWTWEQLASLTGWKRDGTHRDAHGEGFWLKATLVTRGPVGAVYGVGEADSDGIEQAIKGTP